jgi:outer membrane protein assembly factor BamB
LVVAPVALVCCTALNPDIDSVDPDAATPDSSADATLTDSGGGDTTTGPSDATADASDGSLRDGTTSDAQLDSSSDGGAPDGASPDAGSADSGGTTAVPGCELAGALDGSVWPMAGYCPSGRYRAPLPGPSSSAAHQWTFTTSGGPEPVVGPDGTLYVATGGTNVVALDPSDGGTLWTYSDNEPGASYQAIPVLAADGALRVFDFTNWNYSVLGLDAAAAPPVKFDDLVGPVGPANVTIGPDAVIYARTTYGYLLAMDLTGKRLWQLEKTKSSDTTYPSLGAGLVFTNNSNSSYLFASYAADGGTVWDAGLDGGTMSAAAVAVDGTLRAYGATDLYKIDSATGAVLWHHTADTQGIYGIAVADDGSTYVAGASHFTRWSSDGAQTAIAIDPYNCTGPTIDANGYVYAICTVSKALSVVCFDAALRRQWFLPIPVNDAGVVAPGFGHVVVGSGERIYVTTKSVGGGNPTGTIEAYGPP